MATQKATVEFILGKLGNSSRLTARPMFGEYALYAEGKVVALICDNQLYVKILPASAELEELCDKDAPYKGAKPHYLIEEAQLHRLTLLPRILLAIAKALPSKPGKRPRP